MLNQRIHIPTQTIPIPKAIAQNTRVIALDRVTLGDEASVHAIVAGLRRGRWATTAAAGFRRREMRGEDPDVAGVDRDGDAAAGTAVGAGVAEIGVEGEV
jgi:hypothetical protein